MKHSFFQAAVVSILLYGCTTWTLTKWLERKLDGNYTRMLRAILNKSWRQHPTKHQLYGHLPPTMKTIQVRWTRHAGHCWRSRDELISDVFLWTPTYGRVKARGDEWLGKVVREDQGYPCLWHDMMMMMIFLDNILFLLIAFCFKFVLCHQHVSFFQLCIYVIL